eukprot:12441489-Prorocentrum_lima.AAC.1
MGPRPSGAGQSPHPRRFRISRWEDILVACFGSGYTEEETSNTGWMREATASPNKWGERIRLRVKLGLFT